jgi:serine/threonine protein kinase
VPVRAALDMRPDRGAETRPLLVVLERVTRGGAYGDAEIADWVRDARRLATLEHPNIARTRDVVVDGQEVLVVSEFIDGVRWSDIVSAPRRVSLEIALRVLLDALSGLSAVHNLRDAKREPLKLVHGELTPDCLVLGMDGIARVVSTCRLRSATARPGRDGNAYLAPEVLLEDETADARADVYSVGVMLWEALSGRPLFPNTQPSAIVTLLLSGKVVRASIPDGSPWAAPLADVASRALSADPEKRFPSAAALATELRRIAGPRLAPPVRVAAFVRAMFGDRVQARRAELERGEMPEDDFAIPVEEGPESVEVSLESSAAPVVSPTAPTPVPPPPDNSPSLPRPARGAGKRPVVPALRPRLPTLTGLAPPASVAPPPLLSMPTPYVSFEVPSAARIPVTDRADVVETAPAAADQADLVETAPADADQADLVETPPAAVDQARPAETPRAAVVVPMVAAPPATPARGFGSAMDDVQPAARRRRATLAAWVAGPLTLGAAAIVWWLATRPPALDTTPQTATATGAALAPLSTPSSELPSSLPASSGAAGTAPAPTPLATDHPGDSVPADAAFGAPPTAPAAPTATSTATATTVPPRWPAATGTAPTPAPRPSKRKYEPEGI